MTATVNGNSSEYGDERVSLGVRWDKTLESKEAYLELGTVAKLVQDDNHETWSAIKIEFLDVTTRSSHFRRV